MPEEPDPAGPEHEHGHEREPDDQPGRRAPSRGGERVDGVPVLERTPVDTGGLVTIESSEVTAWCPYEGTADYYTVRLEYLPDGHAVELMSLRDYFQTFRDEEIGHEAFAQRVYDDLTALLEPAWLRLTVDCPPRYGLDVTVTHRTGPAPASASADGAHER
jgi:7-cyano-7-deazaguanine reductase